MIIDNQPYLIEYNVRMGDPECQTILPKLKSDLLDIFYSCVTSNLNLNKIEWHDDKSMCIVLCSKGYPDDFENNIEIQNLNKLILKIMNIFFMLVPKKLKQNFFKWWTCIEFCN